VADYQVGDLVVLKSGSMRMCVENVTDDGKIATVWCNEGVIGRDAFDPALLNKWEHRDDAAPRGGDRKPYGGDRGGDRKPYGGGDRGDRGGKSFGGKPGYRDRDGDERPPKKTGWDGKPREKKYFRKDD
jgi:uncharacterized protein YodC (DUF2158 family)